MKSLPARKKRGREKWCRNEPMSKKGVWGCLFCWRFTAFLDEFYGKMFFPAIDACYFCWRLKILAQNFFSQGCQVLWCKNGWLMRRSRLENYPNVPTKKCLTDPDLSKWEKKLDWTHKNVRRVFKIGIRIWVFLSKKRWRCAWLILLLEELKKLFFLEAKRESWLQSPPPIPCWKWA